VKRAALQLDRGDTGLVLVDAQVKLAAAMPQAVLERVLRNWLVLIEMSARMRMPVAVSEQYPRGLGRVLPVLKEAVSKVMPPAVWFEKVEFSAADAPLFQKLLDGGRKNWIVCGMEAHICVFQTARALVARGYRVFVPVDGVVSRQKHNFRVGVSLMQQAGVVVTSTETLLFDLLGSAEGDEFRALSKLIR